ncbi:MAG: Helix-turn-helix domain protein [Candidatus Izimaplasma bacterium HR2]|nr:MAG: Helix-turn-helix domain protein [Candidatus Izimaplasma bacterium HR2]
MSISSLKNKVNKRVKNSSRNDFQDIGGYIKKKRKELNVTQDIVSSGICSVSYLSKIENNQIVPKEFYIREIMEKLDVDKEFFEKDLNDSLYLSKMLQGMFYLDDDLIESSYNEIKDIKHNLTINICKLAYYIYFGKTDDNQYVMMLENLVNNMNDFELKIYLLLASLYYISLEKFKITLEILLIGNKIDITNDSLTAMYSEYTYLVKQRLLKKNCSSDDYESAQGIYSRFHNIKRSIVLALWKSYYISNENPDGALDLLIMMKTSLLDEFSKDFYYLIKAQALYKTKCFNESILCLNNIRENSTFFYQKTILLYEICLIENDTEMCNSINNILKSYKPDKHQLKYKVYYHYLLEQQKDSVKEYLRDIAIPYSIKINDFYGLEKYTNEIMEICIINSRYKEAIQHYKRWQKEKNRISKVLFE